MSRIDIEYRNLGYSRELKAVTSFGQDWIADIFGEDYLKAQGQRWTVHFRDLAELHRELALCELNGIRVASVSV